MKKNKIAVLTGATGGIGSKIAELLNKDDFNLILLAKNKKKLLSLKNKLNKKNKKNKIYIYCFDISSSEAIKENLKKIINKFKKIDILINNAGVLHDSYIGMITEKNIINTLRINLIAPILLTQYLVKKMSKGSSIINISSIIGVKGNETQSVYAASKSGIIGFTMSAAKELSSSGIRVNAVAPGLIQTKMISNIREDKKKELINNINLKRIGKPADVAKLVKFLASDESDYITGQIIQIDGGLRI